MSGGTQCTCSDRQTRRLRWVVLQRHCNHSAFNGYHRTPSDYSTVQCTSCLRVWRTKAAFVEQLPDAPDN